MNCEKCKNKKATLFYADENGGRHALCVTCGAKKDKSIPIADAVELNEQEDSYIPSPSLLSLSPSQLSMPLVISSDTVCRGCGSTLTAACELGELFCPECYSSFGDNIFPTSILDEGSPNVKMPYLLAERSNRKKLLAELKLQLKSAIEFEDFELAAKLRDKIRMLENK